MKYLYYLCRRAIFFLPQILGILLVAFLFVRMIPADPARLMGGSLMPEEGLELLRERMGLKGPVYIQFLNYLKNIMRGDLGVSWYTGNPVTKDIMMRLPATLELLILSFLLTFIIMVPLAIKSVSPGKGLVKNISGNFLFSYGMAAGAFPDFWLALILVFVFFSILGWAPAPVGRLDIGINSPKSITGMYLLDSLLTGNWITLKSSFKHLVLPVFVLAFVYGGAVIKITIVTSNQVQKSEFVDYAKVCGLPLRKIQKYVTKCIYPPIATITAVTFGFLIGGAVLVETVFSWGGLGQYAVQSIVNSDFAAIQGIVLISALINLFVYILVDMIYFWVDPRIKTIG